MTKHYRLEIIKDHLKSDGFLPRVRVIETFNDVYYANTFSDLHDEFNKQIIPEMVEWCAENECGYRTSYDTFKFRNQDQLTMFILRWS
jgi:hypothetical protein